MHKYILIFKIMQVDVKTVRHPVKQLENVTGLRQIWHSSSLEISLLPLEDFVQYIWYIQIICITVKNLSAVYQKTLQLALSKTALLSVAATLQIPGTRQGLHKPTQDPTCALRSSGHVPKAWLLSEGTFVTAVIPKSSRGLVVPWTAVRVYSYQSLKACIWLFLRGAELLTLDTLPQLPTVDHFSWKKGKQFDKCAWKLLEDFCVLVPYKHSLARWCTFLWNCSKSSH